MANLGFSMKTEAEHFVIPFFKVKEFAQKGERHMALDSVALIALNNFRQRFGKPVRITRAYSTPEHNLKVGGVSNSLHLRGAAFDLDLGEGDIGRKTVMLRQSGFNEVMFYPKTGHYHAGLENGR